MNDLETADGPDSLGQHARRRRLSIALVVTVALVAGLVGRSLVSGGAADNPLINWLPWLNRETITVYFGDPVTGQLVPISRTVSHDAKPAEMIDELLAGPDDGTGLISLLPRDVSLVAAEFDGAELRVELSGHPDEFEPSETRDALLWSMASWPGVDEVTASVAGVTLHPASRQLIYFYDEARDMMIARPSTAGSARELIAEFLAGSGDNRLIGLPADVRLLSYGYSAANGLLSLDFTYLPSVRELAVDHPEAMRRVLESLLATLTTGLPEIEAVWLDFEGHEALGLGQCADLLRTAQTQPQVLNDERLLRRYATS